MTDAATKTRHWTDYQVGQQVYGTFTRSLPALMTIRSVGRKYARFEGLRDDVIVEFESTTIISQGYGRIGELYESESAYKEALALGELRSKIIRLSWADWEQLPPEKIKAIAEILGIES
jgi:hypothetical protein